MLRRDALREIGTACARLNQANQIAKTNYSPDEPLSAAEGRALMALLAEASDCISRTEAALVASKEGRDA